MSELVLLGTQTVDNDVPLSKKIHYFYCHFYRVDFRDGKFIRIDEVFVLNLISLHKYSSKQLKFYFKKCHEGLGTIKTEKVIYFPFIVMPYV